MTSTISSPHSSNSRLTISSTTDDWIADKENGENGKTNMMDTKNNELATQKSSTDSSSSITEVNNDKEGSNHDEKTTAAEIMIDDSKIKLATTDTTSIITSTASMNRPTRIVKVSNPLSHVVVDDDSIESSESENSTEEEEQQQDKKGNHDNYDTVSASMSKVLSEEEQAIRYKTTVLLNVLDSDDYRNSLHERTPCNDNTTPNKENDNDNTKDIQYKNMLLLFEQSEQDLNNKIMDLSFALLDAQEKLQCCQNDIKKEKNTSQNLMMQLQNRTGRMRELSHNLQLCKTELKHAKVTVCDLKEQLEHNKKERDDNQLKVKTLMRELVKLKTEMKHDKATITDLTEQLEQCKNEIQEQDNALFSVGITTTANAKTTGGNGGFNSSSSTSSVCDVTSVVGITREGSNISILTIPSVVSTSTNDEVPKTPKISNASHHNTATEPATAAATASISSLFHSSNRYFNLVMNNVKSKEENLNTSTISTPFPAATARTAITEPNEGNINKKPNNSSTSGSSSYPFEMKQAMADKSKQVLGVITDLSEKFHQPQLFKKEVNNESPIPTIGNNDENIPVPSFDVLAGKESSSQSSETTTKTTEDEKQNKAELTVVCKEDEYNLKEEKIVEENIEQNERMKHEKNEKSKHVQDTLLELENTEQNERMEHEKKEKSKRVQDALLELEQGIFTGTPNETNDILISRTHSAHSYDSAPLPAPTRVPGIRRVPGRTQSMDRDINPFSKRIRERRILTRTGSFSRRRDEPTLPDKPRKKKIDITPEDEDMWNQFVQIIFLDPNLKLVAELQEGPKGFKILSTNIAEDVSSSPSSGLVQGNSNQEEDCNKDIVFSRENEERWDQFASICREDPNLKLVIELQQRLKELTITSVIVKPM